MELLITALERQAGALRFIKKFYPVSSGPSLAADGDGIPRAGASVPVPTLELGPFAGTSIAVQRLDAEIIYSISLHPIWLNAPLFQELIATKLYLDLGADGGISSELIEARITAIVNSLAHTELAVFAPSADLDKRFIHYITLKTLTGNTRILARLKGSLGEAFMTKLMEVAEGMVRPEGEEDYFSFFDRLEELMAESIEEISAALSGDDSFLRKVEFFHYFWEHGYLDTTMDRKLAFAVLVAIGIKKQADIAKLRVYLLQHYRGRASEADIAEVLGILASCQLVFKANKVKTAKRQQYSLTSEGIAITRHEVSRKIVAGQQKPVEQLASYNPAYQQAATELLDPANQHLLLKKLERMAASFAFCRSGFA